MKTATAAAEAAAAKATACGRGVDREQANRGRRHQGNHRFTQHHPLLL
ncbi:hypothetical protein H8A99_33580 [Bradyrhizobium sp. Arg68]|nr:hypothetical protein [Bradyrhizobium ivorense]